MGNEGYASSLVPWRGMLLYLVLGVAWVFAGDVLLAHWVTDPALLTRFQTWKGWGYVALTSCLAWPGLVAAAAHAPRRKGAHGHGAGADADRAPCAGRFCTGGAGWQILMGQHPPV